MIRKFSSLFLSACFACAQSPVPAAPQQAAPAAAAPDQPAAVIKISTRLVQVNVVVHDKKGEPVTDLKESDFTISEKDAEQKIRYFYKEDAAQPPQDVPASVEGVVSNRFVTYKSGDKMKIQQLPDSLTVILIDGLNTKFADQARTREALIRFLRQLHPGDQVAVYTLSNGLRILHDFTSDTAALLAAIERHRAQDSAALGASSYDDANTGSDDLDAFLDRTNDKIANFYQARRVETTLAALQTIANHLAGVPGRKNLIWLSGGFPIYVGQDVNGGAMNADFQSYADEVQRTWRVMNDVGLAIYPVDARGLLGLSDISPSFDAASRAKPQRGGGRPAMDSRAQNQAIQTQMTMTELAERTGGRAFMNDNDIAGSVHRAMNDARVSYALFYTPTNSEWDGKFREIKVKVNRPGVDVRYRKGYYALPDVPADPKTREAVLAQAGMSALNSTGVTILARLVEKPTPENPHAMVSVVVDGHDLHFEHNAKGQPDATVDLVMLVFGTDVSPLSQIARSVHLALKPEQYDQILKGGLRMTVDVEAPPNAKRVRVAARDASSGRVGSVDIPLN